MLCMENFVCMPLHSDFSKLENTLRCMPEFGIGYPGGEKG
jgi:hypothetical protein